MFSGKKLCAFITPCLEKITIQGFVPKRCVVSKSPHLTKEEWADKCLYAIGGNIEINSNHVFCLSNPCTSVLTSEILKLQQKPTVFVFERKTNPSKAEFFQELKEQHLEHFHFCFRKFTEHYFGEMLDKTNVNKNYIEKFHLIRHERTLTASLLYYLQNFYTNGNLWKLAPIEMYFFITPKEHKILTDPKATWSRHEHVRVLMYRLFLEHQILLEIPADAFNSKVFMDNRKKNGFTEKLFLTRVKIREDILAMSEKERSDMWDALKFVKYINKKCTSRVIPLMENLCQGIGWDLIEEGIGMLDHVEDIPAPLWLKIHKIAVSHPSYEFSPLKQVICENTSNS